MVKRMNAKSSAFMTGQWVARRRAFLHLSAALGIAAVLIVTPALNAKDQDSKPKRSVNGLVLDASDNPISGATVTLTDLKNGKQLASFTGQEGRYSFSSLETTNDYEVQATYKGVSSRARKVSIVDPRAKITLNLQIPPPKETE